MNYHKELLQEAKTILDDLQITSQYSYEEERDTMMEIVDSSADSAVTYTARAIEIMHDTRNDDAYLDAGIEIDTASGFATIVTQVAYWAYRQDLIDTMEELYKELPETTEA